MAAFPAARPAQTPATIAGASARHSYTTSGDFTESTTRTSPFYGVPPAVGVIRQNLARYPQLAAPVAPRAVRKRIAGCYLTSAMHCLAVNPLGSLRHACKASMLSPLSPRTLDVSLRCARGVARTATKWS